MDLKCFHGKKLAIKRRVDTVSRDKLLERISLERELKWTNEKSKLRDHSIQNFSIESFV